MVRNRGASYQADFSVKGIRYRRDLPSEDAAHKWEQQTRERLKSGETVLAPDGKEKCTTLAELAAFVSKYRWIGASSERHMIAAAKECAEILGRKTLIWEVSDVSARLLVENQRQRGVSGVTINHKLTAFRIMLAVAERFGWLKTLPDCPSIKRSERNHRLLSDDEESRLLMLLERDSPELLGVVLLMLDCGLRLSEAKQLTFRQVRDDGIRIVDRTGIARTVPMTDRVTQFLQSKEHPGGVCGPAVPDDRVFPALRRANLRHEWAKVREAMGLLTDRRFDFECLRTTCIVRWVRSGMPLSKVKQLSGHASIAVTHRYV